MKTKKDIENLDDIKLLVNEFYSKVKKDELLGPIFFGKIGENWERHLEKMYLFWNAALFGIKGYVGNPFSKHITMDLKPEHFSRWLLLFEETLTENFYGKTAQDAEWRAYIMAENFNRKITATKESNPQSKTIV